MAEIERCRFLTSEAQLPAPEERDALDRLYFGNEFCEFRMPSGEAIARLVDTGLPLTLVTPVMTRVGLRRLEESVTRLLAHDNPLEIVVNDFGALESLRGEGGLTLVSGRLLTRNVLDIADDRLQIPSPDAIAYLRDEYGVRRFDLSTYRSKLLPPRTAFPRGICLSLYHPFMYLATTRDCIFRFRDADPETPASEVGCAQPCHEHAFRLRYGRHVEEDLYLKGNTMFVAYPTQPYSKADLAALRVNRIVHFAGLPA